MMLVNTNFHHWDWMRDQELGPRNQPICIAESIIIQTLSLATAREITRAGVVFHHACHFIWASEVHLKVVAVVHATLRHMLWVTILESKLLTVAVSQHFSTLLIVFEALLFLFERLLASKIVILVAGKDRLRFALACAFKKKLQTSKTDQSTYS